MTTDGDIWRSINIPNDIASAAINLRMKQDRDRGDWDDPRLADQPEAPWPAREDPALRYLMYSFNESVKRGIDLQTAAIQLAVHAWFEGGVANYDRGQRDGRDAQ
jgi:hypothetical protein